MYLKKSEPDVNLWFSQEPGRTTYLLTSVDRNISKHFLPAMSFSLIRVLPIEVTMLFLTPPEVLPGIHCGGNKAELVHRN